MRWVWGPWFEGEEGQGRPVVGQNKQGGVVQRAGTIGDHGKRKLSKGVL